jgi:hypothetical protein
MNQKNEVKIAEKYVVEVKKEVEKNIKEPREGGQSS